MRPIGQIVDDILDVQLRIAAYTDHLNRLQKELTEAREAKRKTRISLPEMRARNKQRGRDFVAKLEVGDFIRLVGVRNTRFNWRKVVSFNESTVTSWAYRDWETDRKSTRLNSSHITRSRMPSSA